MSLTLQSALNHFKIHFLDIKIQAFKGTKFSSSIEKSILGCFHPSQKPNWYMDSWDGFAVIVSVLYLLFKTRISLLVKFDSKV